MSMTGRVAAIVWKDLLIEVRTKASFHSMLFFAALVLFVFSFAIGPDVPAGGLEGLRMAPGDPRAIYLGKLFGNIALLLAMEMILFPASAVLFQLEIARHALPLAGIAILGTVGFSVVGTFYAALTLNLRAREILLPLLLIPALIPPLLGAVNSTQLILDGNPLGEVVVWVRLMVAYDVTFFVVCTWIFPIAVEE